jgi:hypothetical protein
MEKCLDKAITSIPACDQVTDVNELAELTTLYKALDVIIRLTCRHDETKIGIAAVGGVETVVKIIKTFPKCQRVQEGACGALRSLTKVSSIGKVKAVESGGIELLLAAINNHLDSTFVCKYACLVLYSIVRGSKENTELLIRLGGGAAVAKVRRKWPNDEDIQTKVRKLATTIIAEMKAWVDKE